MQTFGKQFYPTPGKVTRAMMQKVAQNGKSDLVQKYILDPSAGSGAILEEISSFFKYDRYKLPKFHAVEIDPDLQNVLRGKEGISVVGEDFLQFQTAYNYDFIFMNPPFAEGAKHLLKAWEIAGNTQIVCLLNEETIKNPYTEERKTLLNIIQDHGGEVEYLGPCFDNAFRKTGVNVAMVHLKKSEKVKFEFDAEQLDREVLEFPDDPQNNLPAVRDVLKNYENAYFASMAAWQEMCASWSKFYHASSILRDKSYVNWVNVYQEKDFNGFVEKFQEIAWNKVLEETKFQRFLTADVRKSLLQKFATQKNVAFTKANILAMIEILFLNQDKILNDCLEEIFDDFTRYYHENRVYKEGWKHNDAYMVSRKVVLPRRISFEEYWGFKITDSQNLDDIDRALCHLTGQDVNNIVSIQDALKIVFDSLDRKMYCTGDNVVESEFFEIRFFKKGTLHLTFLDKKLWEKFNITVCKHKGWLQGEKGQSFQRKRAA